MPDVAELGRRVKAKYPDAYGDIPDAELGTRVKAKFPGAYDDFTDAAPAAATPTSEPKTWAQKLGVENPILKAIVDYHEGGAAGLATTLQNIGEIPGKILGQGWERTPEGEAARTAPPSLAGSAGRAVEGAAEFAVPLSKLSKATAGMGIAKRVGAEALGGGGVAALQSGGDPAATALGAAGGAAFPVAGAAYRGGKEVVKRAAEGAAEGGVGGATARMIRGVSGVDPIDTMFRAIKPRATKVNFREALKAGLPELKASEASLGKPIETVEDLMTAVSDAKRRIWSAREEILGPARERGSQVDLSPVADAIQKSIPSRTKLMDPSRAASIIKDSDAYRKKATLQEAEELLKNANDELEAFYNKYPQAQRAKLASDPAVAPVYYEAKALRDAIEKTLGAEGQGAGARELSRRYGQLMEIEGQLAARANVARRQQPESLSEQMAGWSGAGDIARGAWALSRGDVRGMADIVGGHAKREGAKFLKEQQQIDNMIRRAMEAVSDQPAPYPKATPANIRGLLESGPIRQGAGPDPSGIRAAQAKSIVVRDPKTGRMKRIYTSEER